MYGCNACTVAPWKSIIKLIRDACLEASPDSEKLESLKEKLDSLIHLSKTEGCLPVVPTKFIRSFLYIIIIYLNRLSQNFITMLQQIQGIRIGHNRITQVNINPKQFQSALVVLTLFIFILNASSSHLPPATQKPIDHLIKQLDKLKTTVDNLNTSLITPQPANDLICHIPTSILEQIGNIVGDTLMVIY